jgi:hypothetical protein
MAAPLYHMIVVTDAGVYIVRSDGFVASLSVAAVSDVTFYSGVPARFAVLSRYAVLVNATSQPIWFDTDASSHYVSLRPPSVAPGVAGTGTGLTGAYTVWVSFLIKDASGNVLGQSPLSPASAPFTAANQSLALTSIPISTQSSINARRLYRSTAGGSVALAEVDIDDNVTTSFTIGAPDAALGTVAAPTATLGTAPSRLTNIVEWKSRLWAVSANLPDTLVATDVNQVCAWPLSFQIAPVGADSLGITGFLPRRDELGICKRGMIWKMTGDATTNFAPRKLVDAVGCISPDSCKVIADVGYFLGGPKGIVDGIYKWDSSGVSSITDARVRPWFTTDTYFNRAEFPNAVAAYHPGAHSLILFLASAGQTTLDRWIAYDIQNNAFFGPHKTGEFTPSASFVGFDANGNGVLMVGGTNGYVYRVNPGVYSDGAATAIDFDVYGKPHAGEPPLPDITKVWRQPAIFGAVESGGTLNVTPYLGDTDAVAGTTQTHDLTKARDRLARLGVGRLCQLRLQQATAARGVTILGYQLPYNLKGRR